MLVNPTCHDGGSSVSCINARCGEEGGYTSIFQVRLVAFLQFAVVKPVQSICVLVFTCFAVLLHLTLGPRSLLFFHEQCKNV